MAAWVHSKGMVGRLQGVTGGVIAAQATGAMPDGGLPGEMTTDRHSEARTGPATRLLGQVQGEVVHRHDVSAADDALGLPAEDLVERGGAKRDEG